MSEYKNKISMLSLENFTVFEKARFDFCPGINVLIGANGTGKSHLMKVAYSLVKAIHDSIKAVYNSSELEISETDFYTNFLEVTLEDFFKEIFRLDKINYLIRKNQSDTVVHDHVEFYRGRI